MDIEKELIYEIKWAIFIANQMMSHTFLGSREEVETHFNYMNRIYHTSITYNQFEKDFRKNRIRASLNSDLCETIYKLQNMVTAIEKADFYFSIIGK